MTQSIPSNGHSARVRIDLCVNGRRIRVAKVGPDRLFLAAPEAIPESTGEVVMHIDGHERRWRVVLQPTDKPERIIQAQFKGDQRPPMA